MGWDPTGWQPEGWQPGGWQPTADGGTPSDSPRLRCRVNARWCFTATYMPRCRVLSINEDGDYLFPDIPLNAGEEKTVELDLYDICAAKWLSNKDYGSSQFALPRTPTGFSYEATTAGRSGPSEPRWPLTIGATVRDGSVIWTCRAAGTNAIFAVTSPSAVSDPSGLTISGVAASESFKILATYSGGTDGETYEAVFSFTLNGQTRKGRQRVVVGAH